MQDPKLWGFYNPYFFASSPSAATTFGVQPRAAELGRMVSDGRAYVFTYPWIVSAPGFAILLASLGFNLVGDAARDIFDPRLRR